MKIEGKKTEQDFKPVQVTFTFETQKELDVIGSLFNNRHIMSKVRELTGGSERLTKPFEELGADLALHVNEFDPKNL